MPLTKLQFRPGINREITSYSNEGGWYDCDKVRFRFGFPEKIGGWLKLSAVSFIGTCRALHPWIARDGSQYLGVGTHRKYYINEGGGYNDVTPLRLTTAAGAITFSAAANTLASDVVVVDTKVSLTSSSGFPDSGIIKIDDEIIRYASVNGNDLEGLTRGISGTTTADHASGTAVLCSTLVVDHPSHGALDNDFVTYSGATALGGNVTADVLNQEYEITHIIDDDTYQIEARTVQPVSAITVNGHLEPNYVFATTSDTGNGGSSVVGAYQINTGLDTTIGGTGWGAGFWGRGAWGSGTALNVTGAQLRIWTHDNFGGDLLMNVRDGGIYYWDKDTSSGSPFSRAVSLDSLPGANTTPTIAKQVLVSDRDRHILAFGCDGQFTPGVQDPMLIRFSSQESLTDWASTPTNTAGDLRLGSGSEIVVAVETRQQVLVFTDTSLYAMQFLGPPFTFGAQMVSENTTIKGSLAAVAVDDQVFWMGDTEFYVFNGSVTRIPCSVRDYVFDDMNNIQKDKVVGAINRQDSEVWWFYPSADSNENNRYVVFNYLENSWYFGTMSRTFWLDRGTDEYPIAASPDSYLYNHEIGLDDGSTSPASAITAYVRSSPMDLADGEQFAFVKRMLPDIGFRNSSAPTPTVDITTRVRNASGGAYLRTTTSAVNADTEQVHLRLRGRQFSIYVESSDPGVTWRLGSMRYDIQPDGMR